MPAKLSAQLLREAQFPAWNHFLTLSPQGSIYSSPEYLGTLCEAAGGTFKILAVKREDEIVGGVGLYEVRSPVGTYVSPRLLLYYNGLVFRDYETKYPSQRTSRHLEVMDAIEKALSHFNYARVVLKNQSSFSDARLFQERGWAATPTYTYVVPLTDLDALRNRIEQNLRRLIHRCTNEGLQLSEDDDFESFYRMHEQTVERKGTTRYLNRRSFQRYFERLRLQGLCRLFHARLPSGRSISSQLVLIGPYACSHTVTAATDAEYLSMGATAFLRWKVFEALSQMGYRGNDLTDAALNPVTHFKSQLGGDLQMCLVLEKPASIGFRAYQSVRDLAEFSRGAAGALARRVLRMKNS